MKFGEIAISTSHEDIGLPVAAHSKDELLDCASVGKSNYTGHIDAYRMLVVSHRPPHRSNAYCSHVDVPAMDGMTLWHIDQQSLFISSSVYHLHLRELDPLLVARRRGDTRDHHQLDQFLALSGQLPALGLFKTIFGGGNMLRRE